MKIYFLLITGFALANAWVLKNDYPPKTTIAMSRDFLSSSKDMINPRGYGSCNVASNTCRNPPAACPQSSCCMAPTRGGSAGDQQESSCGCLDKSGPAGNATNSNICQDPTTFHVGVEGSIEGKRHQADLQIFSIPPSTPCEDGATKELVKSEDGSVRVKIITTTCHSADGQRTARGGKQSFEGGTAVVFYVQV